MKTETENLIASFKPEFGNEQHIRAVELIGRIKKKDALAAKLKKDTAALKKVLKEIGEDEKRLHYLISK